MLEVFSVPLQQVHVAENKTGRIKQNSFTHLEHLHAHQFEALRLEPFDDLADDASLHAVGLDGDECSLLQLSHGSGTQTGQIQAQVRMKAVTKCSISRRD